MEAIGGIEEQRQVKILTVQEVANILRVHRSTITRYALSGLLTSHVLGNRRLFKESDVWKFFDNQVDRVCAIEEEA
jgi:excisionase family DNA binding protein